MRTKTEPTVRDEPTFIEAARRAQIVQCAIEAIAELGFERASLAEIARRARVSKSVISYYFAGKDELIEHVVADVYSAGAAFMLSQIERQPTPASMLRAYIASNIAYMAEHRQRMQAVVEIVSSWRHDDGRPRFDASAQEQVIVDLERVLRWGQETGEFRAFSTSIMAVTIRAAIDAIPARLVMQPDLDLEQYERELIDLFQTATRAIVGAQHAAPA